MATLWQMHLSFANIVSKVLFGEALGDENG